MFLTDLKVVLVLALRPIYSEKLGIYATSVYLSSELQT